MTPEDLVNQAHQLARMVIQVDIFCRLPPPVREYISDVFMPGGWRTGVMNLDETMINVMWDYHETLAAQDDPETRFCATAARALTEFVREEPPLYRIGGPLNCFPGSR